MGLASSLYIIATQQSIWRLISHLTLARNYVNRATLLLTQLGDGDEKAYLP